MKYYAYIYGKPGVVALMIVTLMDAQIKALHILSHRRNSFMSVDLADPYNEAEILGLVASLLGLSVSRSFEKNKNVARS